MIIKAIFIEQDRGFRSKEFGLKKDLPKETWVITEFMADKTEDFTLR